MDSRAMIGHGLGWLLRGSVCLVAPLGLACTVEDVPEAYEEDEVEDDLEFRDEGCGAQRKKGTVSQTCKYTPKVTIASAKVGTCIGSDKLECEFEHPCDWKAAATTAPACLSGEPACPAKAAEVLKYKVTYDLPSGSKFCDPDDQGAQQRMLMCHGIYLSNSRDNKINGKTVDEILTAECEALTTPDTVKDVECCVAKASGEPGEGYESEGYESDGGWTTSDDGSSAGGSSDDSASGSGGSGGEECPPGSTLQCSGGGDGPLACTCVMAEPLPLPPP